MNRKLILAIFVAVVAIYVGYFASLPVPEGLPEPWKMRAFVMVRYTVCLELLKHRPVVLFIALVFNIIFIIIIQQSMTVHRLAMDNNSHKCLLHQC